jgi:threonylcarbamoyladenosine tRNA methylthiotransferase CDKAL1
MSKTFFIKTFGCASNFADSGFVTEILKNANYAETTITKADFVLVNSCTVKGPTESKIKDYLQKIKKKKYNIIIMGCLPSDKKFISDFKDYSMLSSYNIDCVLELLNNIQKTEKPIQLLKTKILDKTKFSYGAKNIAIVQPLIGCLGKCTYCKTKLAKPEFYSYPLENILQRIDYYIKKGVKEIWISSEDNAAYGQDIKLNYLDLLNAIEKKFAGKAMFRFGMSNPWLIKKNLKELISFFKKTKSFYKFLHIPIQSASSNVLKNMKRPYTEKDLLKIFSELRKNFSANELTIATDTIVGFPNESKEDFEKTVNFTIKSKYDILINNVSQFWPMSFTEAAKMKQLSTKIKKDRSRILSESARKNYKKMLAKYIAKTVDIYFDDIDEKGNYLGRTRNYISVILKKSNSKLKSKPKVNPKLGFWEKYKIKDLENYHLIV